MAPSNVGIGTIVSLMGQSLLARQSLVNPTSSTIVGFLWLFPIASIQNVSLFFLSLGRFTRRELIMSFVVIV
jgi:hypothetical protein